MAVPCSMSNKTACLGKDADVLILPPLINIARVLLMMTTILFKATLKIKENRGVPTCVLNKLSRTLTRRNIHVYNQRNNPNASSSFPRLGNWLVKGPKH